MKLQALESWRGVTALMVVLFHAPAAHSLFLQDWFRHMAPILDFFFMLSGFVMALGFSDKIKDSHGFWAYVIRRAGRVWPLHLAMLALLLPVPLLSMMMGGDDPFWGWRSLEALWRNIILTQTWSPHLAFAWNFPAWTLSVEIFAYLLLGLIALVAVGPRTFVALVLAVLAFDLWFFWNAMETSPTYNVVSVSRGLFGFFLGVLLYLAWKRWPLRNKALAHVLEPLALAGFVATLVIHPGGVGYFTIYIAHALLIYAFSSDLGFVSKLLNFAPLNWVGKVSFSMYMFHGVVVRWMLLAIEQIERRTGRDLVQPSPSGEAGDVINLGQTWMNDLLMLGYVVFVLICTHFIFHWIENPSRAYFAKLSRKALARPATAGASTAAQ